MHKNESVHQSTDIFDVQYVAKPFCEIVPVAGKTFKLIGKHLFTL